MIQNDGKGKYDNKHKTKGHCILVNKYLLLCL